MPTVFSPVFGTRWKFPPTAFLPTSARERAFSQDSCFPALYGLCGRAEPRYARKGGKTLCDNARFRSVCGTFNPTFHGYSNGISDEKCRAFFDGACTVYRADNRRVYIDRALSSSYSLKEGDERFAAYVQARGEIFRSLCGRRAHHRADGHGHVYRKGLNRKRLPRLTERKKKR